MGAHRRPLFGGLGDADKSLRLGRQHPARGVADQLPGNVAASLRGRRRDLDAGRSQFRLDLSPNRLRFGGGKDLVEKIGSDFLDASFGLPRFDGGLFDRVIEEIFPIPAEAFLVLGANRKSEAAGGSLTLILVGSDRDAVLIPFEAVLDAEFHG